MKNSLIFTLLLTRLFLCAQNSTIEIQKELFHGTTMSLVLLTNQAGEILIDWEFEAYDDTENTILNYTTNGEKYDRLDLTIFNEYTVYGENANITYFRALTYQNIPDNYLIDGFGENGIGEDRVMDYQNITINILGVETVDYVELYASKFDDENRWKARRGTAQIKYKVPLHSDFYAVLFCNGETQPKTIYLKSDEIEPLINLNWKDLNTDIKKCEVSLSNEGIWRGGVTAINEDSGNRATIFEFERFPKYLDSFSFFVPENEMFYDFKLDLFTQEEDSSGKFIRYKVEGENYEIAKPDFSKFRYNVHLLEKDEFNISLDTDKFDLSVSYAALSSGLSQLIYSYWTIENASQNEVQFTFPSLLNYERYYPSMDVLHRLHPHTITLEQKLNVNQTVFLSNTIKDY